MLSCEEGRLAGVNEDHTILSQYFFDQIVKEVVETYNRESRPTVARRRGERPIESKITNALIKLDDWSW